MGRISNIIPGILLQQWIVSCEDFDTFFGCTCFKIQLEVQYIAMNTWKRDSPFIECKENPNTLVF